MNHASTSVGEIITTAQSEFQNSPPLIQCLTNAVVPQITANALLAAGASPAMVDTPEEAADFASVASGVLINTGSPTAPQYTGMREAVRGASENRTPWVLDPVACGGPAVRTAFDRDIVTHRPAAVRGNASEIIALSGAAGGGRGVDSTDEAASALDAARDLAGRTGAVVAVSGARDLIVSTERTTWLESGDPMMQRVIGTGCSLGAMCAAYLSTSLSAHDAVLAAHAHSGAAGTIAASNSSGPGSFAVAWLDALHAVARLSAAEINDLVAAADTAEDH